MKLTFITGNPAKAKYLADYFHTPVLHRKLDLPEIQSLKLAEIIEDKVKRAYDIVRSPVIVEDVSLTFLAFKKLPGPLIKWFLETLGNEGLCKLLNGMDDRSARAEVMYGFCDENGVKTFHGEAHGTIASTPRGETNFGWDPIFIPDGYNQTWAEMTGSEKHATSMRKPALEALAKFLQDHT
ncbi:MAG TPA: non-canonical purine NTP pyrophosphatase [Candidatus Paceibacterota bacterium]